MSGPRILRCHVGVGPVPEGEALVTDDNFSARYERTINFAPGNYRFTSRHDDGGLPSTNIASRVRVWLSSPGT